MDSGHPAQDDILQVIPRRASSKPSLVGSGSTGRIWLPPPARKQRLTRVVVATVGACGLILVAAGIVHLARGKDASAFEATTTTSTAVAIAPSNPATAAPTVAPAAPAVPPPPAEPQSGTVTLQRPATAGHVWLDGQKLNAGSATVPCGKHQVKIGAHGHVHSIDVPCGSEVRVSR
jgi:hypothetical protein